MALRACTDQSPVNTGKVINHQLIAYYTFDANNALDDTLNGFTGTPQNGVVFGAGKIGNAAQFDGVDDYIAL